MSAKRVAVFDNLKAILIFFVVLGHICTKFKPQNEVMSALAFFIYTFHMPAFIFVSGIFCKRSVNKKEFPKEKCITFIVLYLICMSLVFLSRLYFKGSNAEFNIFTCASVPWYMLAMALWYAITWAIKNFKPKYVFVTAIIISCFAGYMRSDSDFMCILRVITFYPFFYAGYILEAEKIIEFTNKKSLRIISAVLLVGLFVFVMLDYKNIPWIWDVLTGRCAYKDYKHCFASAWAIRLAYYAIAPLFVFALTCVAPRRKTFFTNVGSATLQIYILHMPIINLMMGFGLFGLIMQSNIYLLYFVILAVAITQFLSLNVFGKIVSPLLKPLKEKVRQ